MHSIQDVCEIFRASRSAVLSWITSGELAATDVAPHGSTRRFYRIAPESLEAFRKARQSGPVAPKSAERPGKIRSFV